MQMVTHAQAIYAITVCCIVYDDAALDCFVKYGISDMVILKHRSIHIFAFEIEITSALDTLGAKFH